MKGVSRFFLAGLLALAACAPAATPTAAPSGGATPATPTAQVPTAPTATLASTPTPMAERVRVAVVLNLFGTPWFAGVETGIFAKHGLQVEIMGTRSGQESAKALAAGDVLIGSSAMNNFQAEIAAGSPNVAVDVWMGNGATVINDQPLAIVARGDRGIRANHPEDLKGKTVGLSAGGTAELYLRTILAKAGVDAKDVKMVNIPQENWLAALQSGQVDAVSGWEPFVTMMTKQVPGSVVVSRNGGHFGYVIFTLVRKDTLQKQRDLVKRVVAAHAEAMAWVRQNPEKAGEIASHWIQGLDPKIAAEAMKNVVFDPRITPFTKQAWDISNQLLVQQGRLKAPVPMEGHFDTSLLEEVIKEHPEYFKDLQEAPLLSLRLP
ncbi:ABC transporter substrate-binding protein [Thermoflexus hugenholtzii]